MRDTSPVGSKRIQLWLPVSFNLGSSANTSSPLFFQSLSFSWMPPLQCKLGLYFKSKLTWLEMIENLAKTELCYLKTTFALHLFLLWFVALPSPPPSRAGWDDQARVYLHCCCLSEYQDECWAYAEPSLHLCSQLQQAVCRGAVRIRITESSAHSSSLPCSFCCWSSVTPGSDSRASLQHPLGSCDSSQPVSHSLWVQHGKNLSVFYLGKMIFNDF